MPMKLALGTAAIAALITAPVLAADLRMPVKAPVAAPAPVATWSGCYIDGGFGYGMWNQRESERAFGLTTGTYENGGRGWLGRVGAGCDFQAPGSNFVIGAFGDYDFMGLSGTVQRPNFTATGAGGLPIAADEKESRAWSVGGRIGYVITPGLLSFVDAGYTETRFNQRNYFALLTGAPIGVSAPEHTYSGWFLGGGVEYALNLPIIPIQGLFWRTEYRFSQYRKDDLPPLFNTATATPTGDFLRDEKFVPTVTSSLVWRFNFGGPVAPQY
jgi:outer membrane immunogenic protein